MGVLRNRNNFKWGRGLMELKRRHEKQVLRAAYTQPFSSPMDYA